MISVKSEFKFLDRGFKDILVLIGAWATDYRIFDELKLDYNYLLTTKLSFSDFNQELLNKLHELKAEKVSLFGFSLGGFIAAEFAAKYPQKIAELILVGVRRNYEPKILENIKLEIQKNKRTWLYKFYLNCFSRADKQGLSWFRKNLLKEYQDSLSLDELICGLDYLAGRMLSARDLTKIRNIRIFHGNDDIIAPIEEALEIKSGLPEAKFVPLANAGHLPFLNHLFRERFYSG